MLPSEFQQRILAWFDQHGRKDLPWQRDITPYRVWLSEIMLQQTQVTTVIPFFKHFFEKFPTIESLAHAELDEVLQLWSGLGYYARARNLHKTARLIAEQGRFPDTLGDLTALPGIGLSTGGAILSIAFKNSHPILDGNVKRVLTRFYAIDGWPGIPAVNKLLWQLSSKLTPSARVADYTQAMMDLGATLCKRSKPVCMACPLQSHCLASIGNNTMAFPAPRPAKILPVKPLVFLVLTNHLNEILLEKRLPAGIWGGLWSLPEFDSIEAATHWCMNQHIPMLTQEPLPSRRHSFSHYHLEFTPLLVQTDNPNNFVMEGNVSVWYKAEQIDDLGLAAPIKRLLKQHLNRGQQ